MCVTLVIVEVLVVLVVVIQQGSAHLSWQPSIAATDEQVKPAKAMVSQVADPLHGELQMLLGHPSGGSTAITSPMSSHAAPQGTIKRTPSRLDRAKTELQLRKVWKIELQARESVLQDVPIAMSPCSFCANGKPLKQL